MKSDPAASIGQSDLLDPARAQALQLALGHAPTLRAGSALPPFFHHLYFWEPIPPEGLGRDGHPKLGGLIPDMGLPRRMWAGGRLEFHADCRLGERAEKHSILNDHKLKEGRSGPLALITLRHDIRQDGQLCLTEDQDLVYRRDADPDAPRPVPPDAPSDPETALEVSFDTTVLFRYSALTFNGHRIHYDLDYARDVEGYDGLVVHGPLLAQLLMLRAVEELGPLRAFSFRATSPLMHFERATLCRKGHQLWVQGPDGRMCMQAEARTR